MSMLVQWSEVGGGAKSGEMVLPTLPVPGQHISFGHITDDDGEAVDFRIETATWYIDRDIIEGHIAIRRTGSFADNSYAHLETEPEARERHEKLMGARPATD